MILGKLLATIAAFLSTLAGESVLIWNYGLPSPGSVLIWLLVLAVWFGSAFFAATVAELFHHRVAGHFLLGLLLPYLYPIWLTRHIQVGAAQQAAEAAEAAEAMHDERKAEVAGRFAEMQAARVARRRTRLDGEAPDEAEMQQIAAELTRENAAATDAAEAREAVADTLPEAAAELYRQIYDLPADDEGVRNGPFALQMQDGSQMVIDAVRGMQPEFMMCAVSATGKTVRVKYQNVAAVSRIDG